MEVDLTTVSVVSGRTGEAGWDQYSSGSKIVVAVSQPDLVDRLGDDPEPLPLAGLVGAEDAAAVDQGGVVEAAVLVVEVAPVAGDVAGEELIRRLPGFVEGVEGSGRADDPPEAELLGVSCLTHACLS